MKDLEFSKKLDELGRVVLPVEIRQSMSLEQGDKVSFFMKDGGVFLKKCIASCVCCQTVAGLKKLPHGKYICAECLSTAE